MKRIDTPTLLKWFDERCQALVSLAAIGEMSLQTAVDEARSLAIGHGVLASLGEDELQAVLNWHFRGAPRSVGVCSRSPRSMQTKKRAGQKATAQKGYR